MQPFLTTKATSSQLLSAKPSALKKPTLLPPNPGGTREDDKQTRKKTGPGRCYFLGVFLVKTTELSIRFGFSTHNKKRTVWVGELESGKQIGKKIPQTCYRARNLYLIIAICLVAARQKYPYMSARCCIIES